MSVLPAVGPAAAPDADAHAAAHAAAGAAARAAARAAEPESLTRLRARAAARLGRTPAAHDASVGRLDALSALHALASSPGTASDALALLHELQVHQVELELQAQELDESRAVLESALHLQLERFDRLPVGCFTVDAQGLLLELNATGAAMLGRPRGPLVGLPLGPRFGIDGERRFRAALADAAADGAAADGVARPACRLVLGETAPGGPAAPGAGRPVLAHIGRDAVAGRYLVSLTELPA